MEVTYGLKKISFVETAKFKYIDVNIDLNTLLLGDSGVGKTSIMRAVLFFYTMNSDKAILGISDSETKQTFADWYFDRNGGSHIIYEYQTQNGKFLFIVSRNTRLQYTFIDIDELNKEQIEEIFLDEDDVTIKHEKIIANLISKNIEYYTTQKKDEYRNIFCLDEYKKMSSDFRKKNLSEVKYYLYKNRKDIEFYGKYLSKIFLNNKVSESSIKNMLTSLLDVDAETDIASVATIDIDDIQLRLEKIEQKESDYKRFVEKIDSGKLDKLESQSTDYKHFKNEILGKKRELLFIIENSIQINFLVKEEHKLNKFYFEELDEQYKQKENTFKEELRAAEDKLLGLNNNVMNVEKKKREYEKINITKILRRYKKKEKLEQKKLLLNTEKNLLSKGIESLDIEMQQSKLDSTVGINEEYENEENKLINELSTASKNYKVIAKIKDDRMKAEAKPLQNQVLQAENTVKDLKHTIELEKKTVEGLKNSKLDNETISDLNEKILRTEVSSNSNDTLLSNVREIIKEKKLQQIKNSETYTEVKDTINQKNNDANYIIGKEITTLNEKKERMLCFDKDSLFGTVNKENSKFKDLISFIVKDEILHDESIFITKDIESNTLYGYKLDVIPQTIDGRVADINYKIKIKKSKIINNNVDTKKKIGDLDSKTLRESKKLKQIIFELERNESKYLFSQRSYKVTLGKLDDNLKSEVDKEKELIKTKIADAIDKIILDNKKLDLHEGTLFELSAKATAKEDSIEEEYLLTFNTTETTQTRITSRQDAIKQEKNTSIDAANKEIEGIYKKALEDNGSDPKKINYLTDRVEQIRKLLGFIKDSGFHAQNYINQDKKLIDGLAKEIEKVEVLKGENEKLELFHKKTLSVLKLELDEKEKQYKTSKKRYESINEFFSDKDTYIEECSLRSVEVNFETSVDDAIHTIKTDIIKVVGLPDRIKSLLESVENQELKIKEAVREVVKGFSKDNTLSLAIIDSDIDHILDYLSVGNSYIAYRNNGLYKQGKGLALDDLSDTIRLISSHIDIVRDKIQQMETLIDEVNITISKNIEDIKVLDRLQIKYTEDTHNEIISSLDRLIEYSDKNSYIYFGSLTREEDQTAFDYIYKEITIIVKLLKNSKKRKIFIEDLITITFRVFENGEDLGELTTLDDVGSNGTGIMAKAIIYISLLYKNAIKCRLNENQHFHCIMDEIGQISENYFSELMNSAQKRGFIFLNGIPVEAEGMIQLYPSVYTGYSENGVSDFVNTTKEYLEYE